MAAAGVTSRRKAAPCLADYERGIAMKSSAQRAAVREQGTPGLLNSYDEILRSLRGADLSEEARVLYVALTRAQNRLIVTGCVKEKKEKDEEDEGGNSALEWLLLHKSPRCKYVEGTGDRGQGSGIRGQNLSEESEPFPFPLSPLSSSLPPDPYSPISVPYPYASGLRRPAKTTVTEMNNAQLGDRGQGSGVRNEEPAIPHSLFLIPHSQESEPFNSNKPTAIHQPPSANRQPPITSKDAGTAYHEVFRHFELFSKDGAKKDGERCIEDAEAFLNELLQKGLIDEEQHKAAEPAAVSLFLKSPLPDMIKSAEAVYYERSFIYDDGGTLVQGKPDLIIVDGGGLTVVDYKLSGHSAGALKRLYAFQLGFYARAASGILGKPVKGAYIYRINGGELLEVEEQGWNGELGME